MKIILIVCLSFLAFNTYGTIGSSFAGIHLQAERTFEQDWKSRQVGQGSQRTATPPSPLCYAEGTQP